MDSIGLNVDQTHLVLASGKLVLQKKIMGLNFQRIWKKLFSIFTRSASPQARKFLLSIRRRAAAMAPLYLAFSHQQPDPDGKKDGVQVCRIFRLSKMQKFWLFLVTIIE